jgi:hypothetical protein
MTTFVRYSAIIKNQSAMTNDVNLTKTCGCAGCKKQAAVEMRINYGKGGTLATCSEHSPLWTKTAKVGDASPAVNMPFFKGSAYTLTWTR